MPTAIEWVISVDGTQGLTWNPVTGCDRVSPGCAHCYALTLAKRLKAMGQPKYQRDGDPRTSGPGFGVTVHADALEQPLRRRKPTTYFVNSMSDLFHEQILDAFVAEVFDVMARTPQHTFQVLTKRPERARDWAARWTRAFDRPGPWPLPNVWIGVSIENARYTWRADVLRQIPAAVRFISAEPLLGSLYDGSHNARESLDARADRERAEVHGVPDLRRSARGEAGNEGRRVDAVDRLSERPPAEVVGRGPLDLTGIDWLIAGGESGPGHRPMNRDHARELRDACQAAGVAFFFKQVGGQTPKIGGKLLDGREWCELPRQAAAA